jgi:hypothetical protein
MSMPLVVKEGDHSMNGYQAQDQGQNIRQQVRSCIEAMMRGEKPDVLPFFGEYEQEMKLLAENYQKSKCQGNAEHAKRVINALLGSRKFPELEKVMKNEQKEGPSQHTPCPELPKSAQLPASASKDACRWLDEYVAFSRHWSPRGYEGFHTAAGVWLLSAIAARRVWLPLGPNGEYTPLFIAFVADTTQHRKSTTAGIAKSILRSIGLSWLLCPDKITPQKLISNMAGKIPANYSDLSPDDQLMVRKRYAMSAQVAWYYDEFGQHMDDMTAKNSAMSGFKGFLRKLDDCELETSNDTHARDLEEVKNPYMALLASMTIADIRPYATKRDPRFYKDGTFARFGFITPPQSDRNRARFPEGIMYIPPSLTTPLITWHLRLGEPDCEIEEIKDEKGRIIRYDVQRTELPRQVCTYEPEVINAFYNYNDALEDLVLIHHLELLAGNYGRMAKKALRLAMLFASLENNGHIELRHWAKGQEIAESWRVSLHEMYTQVASSYESTEADSLEDEIIAYLTSKQETVTARIMKQSSRAFKNIPAKRLKEALDNLVTDGVIDKTRVGKAYFYVLLAKEQLQKQV